MDPTGVEAKLGTADYTSPLMCQLYYLQRILYAQSIPARESVGSGYTTSNTRSGYQSPREIKEEQWRGEAQAVSRPSKGDMREMYKELGGRKSKGKAKVGGTGRIRDKGGLGGYEEW